MGPSMFGYVKIFKPELKMGEYEQYQGIYCSLCKDLGKRYGLLSRLLLSYDFTFLALFHMATDPACTGFRKARCPYRPTKRVLCCQDSPHIAYAADAAVLLNYYKLKDNIADSGFFRGLIYRLLLPFAAMAYKKAARRQPDLAQTVADCMEKQAGLERDKVASVDAAAEPTAMLLSQLASVWLPDNPYARRFGYCLGRWIYLIDALDDLEEDAATGNYNPYLLAKGGADGLNFEQIRRYALESLNACLAECETAYHLLDRYRFDGIITNILSLGMPAEQRRIVSKSAAGHPAFNP